MCRTIEEMREWQGQGPLKAGLYSSPWDLRLRADTPFDPVYETMRSKDLSWSAWPPFTGHLERREP
jgi:hypothetical protein